MSTNHFKLPMAAEELIPHRLPMRQVDRLLEYEDGGGSVEALVASDNPLLDGEGNLSEVALVEMLAQAFAAVQGYGDSVAGKPVQQGFLVGIRKVVMTARARLGDRLMIQIRSLAQLEGFAVVEGEVFRDGESLATGKLKLWIPPSEGSPQ